MIRPKHKVYRRYDPQRGDWPHTWLPHIVSVVEDFQEAGYTASVRQVYYQLVAHYDLPNTPALPPEIRSRKF